MKITTIIKNKLFPFFITALLIGGGGIVLFSQSKNQSLPQNLIDTQALDTEILKQQQKIKANPKIITPYFSLSQVYLQKIRETADSTYYKKINDLTNTAESIEPNNGEIFAIRASTEAGRHHFKKAQDYIMQAIKLNPHKDIYYGILADTQIELGQYSLAATTLQTMVNMRPSFSSFSRIAYLRELYGDIPGAHEALLSAISSGSTYKENIAWAYVELGKLALRTNISEAEKYFNHALVIVPTYSQAMEGLGRVNFEKGDIVTSEKYFTDAFTTLPLALYATNLADFYTYQGNTIKAKQYLMLAQVSYDSSSSSGVNTDLEESIFLSDHDLNLPLALAKAQTAYKDRPNMYTADALAFAYYKNNQYDKAYELIAKAFVPGEQDPTILFHKVLIAYKIGDTINAKFYLKKINTHSYLSIAYAKELQEMRTMLSLDKK